MVDEGVDFGPDRGARNVGASPGARHQVRGSWRYAEDRCSPDENVVDVFDYYYYNLGLSANSKEVLSTSVNIYYIVNVILLA